MTGIIVEREAGYLEGVGAILTMDTAPIIAARHPQVALIPVGAYEQHGPHLPVTTDTVIACAIAERIARRRPSLRVAPITISCSHEHAGFPGCVALSANTLGHVMTDITQWTKRSGAKLAVIVNGHGGNYVLGNIVQELNVDAPRVLAGPGRRAWEQASRKAGIETALNSDMHAGEVETSILLHLLPGAVRTERIRDAPGDEPRTITFYGVGHYATEGVIGTPSKASAAKGRVLLEAISEQLNEEIAQALRHQSARSDHDR